MRVLRVQSSGLILRNNMNCFRHSFMMNTNDEKSGRLGVVVHC
jgi:hypothetical protein